MGSRTNDTRNAKYALLGMIPSITAYNDFKADMRRGFTEVMPALLDYAASCGLIKEKTEAAFLSFIENNVAAKSSSMEGRAFADLLSQVQGPKSVNHLLEALNAFARRFRLMPIQASMVSRLKKNFILNTPKKRNVLRLLAFWIGLKRPELGWHYEMLLSLADAQPAQPAPIEEKEGVRIAFVLQAVGDILDQKAVDWLKNELPRCLYDLDLHYIPPQTITFSLSTAHIDLPKEPGPSGEPRLYARAIRESLALAYQMPIRWALSEHSNPRRSMVIAVTAGPFDQADKYIQGLLAVKHSGITPIRMTDMARLCAKIADIKISFNKNVAVLPAGFPGSPQAMVWQVDFFWSYLYYGFVPELLKEDVMPTTRTDYEAFRNELFFPDQAAGTNKALSAIRKFPQDTLLATEVARVLIAKRMFYEADEVLSGILASYPKHLIARTLRAIIYHYLSMHAADPELAEVYFSRSARETDMIEKGYPDETEAHTEIGLLYYTRAIQLIVTFRKGKSPYNREETVNRSTTLLDQAWRLFNKSAAIAPITDMRAEFWIRQVGILRMVMARDRDGLLSGRMLTDRYDIIHDISRQSWKLLGWLRDDSPEAQAFFNARLDKLMKQYAEEVSATNWAPSLKCIFAGFLWHTMPEVSVGLARVIIFLYQEAIQDVERLSRFNIGVYSGAGCYTLIQSPAHFIRNAREYIHIVEKVLNEDLTKPDDHLIAREKIRSVALPFALLDDEAGSEIILKTDLDITPAEATTVIL